MLRFSNPRYELWFHSGVLKINRTTLYRCFAPRRNKKSARILVRKESLMSANRSLLPVGIASIALALAGCGSGGGDGMPANASGPIQGLQPTLASIQDNVFTPICTGCHSGQ